MSSLRSTVSRISTLTRSIFNTASMAFEATADEAGSNPKGCQTTEDEEAEKRIAEIERQKKERARELNCRRVNKCRGKKTAARLQDERDNAQHSLETSLDEQQIQLFNDPRRLEFERHLEESNSEMAAHGKNIFRGLIPRCSGPLKDYTLVSVEQHLRHISQAQPHSIMLLVDESWYAARPQLSRSRFLRHLSSTPTRPLSAQELESSTSNVVTRRLHAEAIVQRFQTSNGRPSRTPLNLLNIPCRTPNLVPPGIAKYCTLLPEACEAIFSEDNTRLGLEKSINFTLCGQAGFLTHWHMDNDGFATWVTVEKSHDEEDDGGTLKYWAMVILDHLSPEHQTTALAEFAKHGYRWQPEPSWVRVFSLVPGHTLIMPGGTIHAVVTVTDCLMTGGMYWDKRIFVSHTLPTWQFIAKNRDLVTNEDPSMQILEVLQWLKTDIRYDPKGYNISPDDILGVEGMIQDILDNSVPCKCQRCGSRCPCRRRGFLCYQDCKLRKCGNRR
ncbi:uncharacterized protein PAC_14800 [Phialocephala subalpina]|uniref:AWS domain-containing protein n=1 Tax=Phialocephala subalpina TaxID=576137 RepID=A0A1L7XIN5_9HELO|nr:uncharacterized protein PAC_14800 [Phialocephala subalpina]